MAAEHWEHSEVKQQVAKELSEKKGKTRRL